MLLSPSSVLGPPELREFLLQLGTDHVAHSRRTLFEHLCGVEAILRAWEQPENICRAGMFHSIYSTEHFAQATLSLDDRGRLQEAIGEWAERLVFLFAVLPRTAVFASVNCDRPLAPDAFAELSCHWNNTVTVRLSGSEARWLALLHMANRLEQAAKPATGVGFWLAWISANAESLRPTVDLPTILANLGSITIDGERRLHSLYLQGVALLQGDDPRGALAYFDDACRGYGCVGEPYLMAAVAHRLLGSLPDAQRAASHGCDLLKRWGAPWHKHLSLPEWLELGDLIASDAPTDEIRRLLQAMYVSHDRAQTALLQEVAAESNAPDLSNAEGQLAASRFFAYLKTIQIHRSSRMVKWYPGLRRKSWYDPQDFPVARDLEARFAEIKAEALAVSPAHYYEEAEDIGRTGSWQVCMFYEQGRRNDAVCDLCPTIAAVLEADSSVRRTAGLIYLSKMAAHTHVTAHQGGSNIRVRCHLALTVPTGDCAIRVGGESRRWTEGKCIVFDDTYEHEIWNRTAEERLVLLVDLWHPDLTALERDAMDTLNWLSMHKATNMLGTWQRNDGQREREGKASAGSHL
jgi:hypothetical protein